MKKPFLLVLLIIATINMPIVQAEYVEEQYCSLKDYPAALRQTHIIIDSTLIVHETDGPIPENTVWRKTIANFINTIDPSVAHLLAPRERVHVSLAQADGSGLINLFTGCVPYYTQEEQRKLTESESSISTFFGKGWRDQLEKDAKQFKRRLTLSLVEAAKSKGIANSEQSFVDSGLGQSLARGYSVSFELGIPRLIILTDMSKYQYAPNNSSIPRARQLARQLSTKWGADFGRSVVHILGATIEQSAVDKEYLKALFLGSKGELVTITGLQGSLKTEPTPHSIEIYRGTIKYSDGEFPVALRLALDMNQRAVNSWIEVQSDQIRFTPFDGALSCKEGDKCTFLVTGEFAQIWTDKPSGDPEFENWMPFAGLRNMKLEIDDKKITGLISDSVGTIEGMETGLPLELYRVDDGIF